MTNFGYNIAGFGAGGIIINGLPSMAVETVDDPDDFVRKTPLWTAGLSRTKFAVQGWADTDTLTGGSWFENNINLKMVSGNRLEYNVDTDDEFPQLITTSTTLVTANTYFHYLLYFDKDNATADDRMRMWIGGVEITAFDTRVNPTSPATGVDGSIDALRNTNSKRRLYQFAIFNNSLPAIGEVISGGNKVNIADVDGLFILLDAGGGDPESDPVSGNWTKFGAITTTSTIPT